MNVGERIIEGQIKKRAEARKIYEQRTNLVEQERPNSFTAYLTVPQSADQSYKHLCLRYGFSAYCRS